LIASSSKAFKKVGEEIKVLCHKVHFLSAPERMIDYAALESGCEVKIHYGK
jgi:hypothetical protein